MSLLAVNRSRSARGAAVLCALLVGLIALPLAPSAAHDELISTDPAPEAVLDAAPQEIALEFSADLLSISPTLVLTGPTGAVVLGEPAVDGTRIAAGVPDGLPAGPYTVAWRVVSGDGHPIQGSFAFEVATPATGPDPAPTTTASAEPSAPTTTPGPTPSPTPTSSLDTDAPTGAPTGGLTAVAIGVAALAAIGALVAVLARRRR
ncbi:copper resistance protein CopC [Actinotalea sp.]|uniref:copper resistance CopC family protein n=1 Tax=Actinotalea sp. TaxID=1872145 RepID=UPI00356747A6